jgi:3-oxoacyl-[acyl-carrier protein] reductase
MSGLSEKVVLITGGTRGIGRACAEAFARTGAKVAICGRDAARAEAEAAALANETGATVRGFGCDMSQPDAVESLVKSVGETLGPIAILVNNAGVTHDGLLMRMKDEDWHAVFRTNLDGAFYASRAAVRDMVKQRFGRIVNISSIVGLRGQAGQSNYAAAKAGIVGFSKSLAQELASRNITVNVVAPGYIETDMTSGFTETQQKAITERIPAKRSGKPEEVAAAVLFLASDAAAYVTGHVLCVDGGLGM